MSDDRSTEKPVRRGWSYTLFKCAALMGTTGGIGALALYLLVRSVEVPWFIPKPVYEWLLHTVGPWAAVIGAVLGVLVGALGSVGVIVYDARKGRLSRVR